MLGVRHVQRAAGALPLLLPKQHTRGFVPLNYFTGLGFSGGWSPQHIPINPKVRPGEEQQFRYPTDGGEELSCDRLENVNVAEVPQTVQELEEQLHYTSRSEPVENGFSGQREPEEFVREARNSVKSGLNHVADPHEVFQLADSHALGGNV